MSATPGFSPRARDKAHPYNSPRLQRSVSSASRPSTAAAVKAAKSPSSVAPLAQPLPAPLAMPPPPLSKSIHTPLPFHDPRTPSPNYFNNVFGSTADVFSSNDGNHKHNHWSPPSSSIRSTAAASPLTIPVESNPDYAAFRKQSEHNKFTLGRLHSFDGAASNKKIPPPTSPLSPQNDGQAQVSGSTFTNLASLGIPEKPRSPKRQHSDDSDVFPERIRRASPGSFTDNSSTGSFQDASFMSPENPNRPSLPSKVHASFLQSHTRADTLPSKISDEETSDKTKFVSPQRVVNLIEAAEDRILLLDLRVSTQYAAGRVAGALSLCIPTTLIKRPSFNVEKLAETFKDDDARAKFESWRSSLYIIVYDASSTENKDSPICTNTLNKFKSAGWTGASYIIDGGFTNFSRMFPGYVVGGMSSASSSRNSSMSNDPTDPSIIPVIGGCPMPATKNAANPFFGNIRQNMDLIGGVGQLSLTRPAAMTKQMESALPFWLNQAIDESNHGKRVSDKFLQIEKHEQKYMQSALSFSQGTPGATKQLKIAGIEKGSKNRYNNIWPYEHSRVKLKVPKTNECDYINASHVRAEGSNKHYIATQAPIPATFNDFWNVIWQQDIRVIVMLTAESEGGQTKAHNYWSDQNYGDFRLSFLSEHRASIEPSKINRHRQRAGTGSEQPSESPAQLKLAEVSPTSDKPYVIVRKFTLSHSGSPFTPLREITQLQYSNWPDFGAPAHPAHLLGLVQQCDAVVRATYRLQSAAPEPPNSRPVLVHCSAGCGRTGTFCTVDTVIDMIKKQREQQNKRKSHSERMELDMCQEQDPFFSASSESNTDWMKKGNVDLVEKAVGDFRQQRLSMVQSLRQFVLCYETVLEWLVSEQAS